MKHYNTPEKVNALLALGDLDVLHEKIEPSPQMPHTEDPPQPGVTVAMGRDMGLSNTAPVMMTFDELTESPYTGIEYTYVFDKDEKWIYFPAGEEYEWRHLKEDLENDTIHFAVPDEKLMAVLGLADDTVDSEFEEEKIEHEMYGGM